MQPPALEIFGPNNPQLGPIDSAVVIEAHVFRRDHGPLQVQRECRQRAEAAALLVGGRVKPRLNATLGLNHRKGWFYRPKVDKVQGAESVEGPHGGEPDEQKSRPASRASTPGHRAAERSKKIHSPIQTDEPVPRPTLGASMIVARTNARWGSCIV